MNFDHQQDDTGSLLKGAIQGLGALLLLALVAVALTWCSARGESVSIVWDANPTKERVTEYRVYLNGTVVAVTNDTGATLEAESGDAISVTAWNGKESEHSESITIASPVIVEIQVSTDLKTWETVEKIHLNPNQRPAQFVRARIQKKP